MATEKGNLFLRNDTIFGVCEGLGEDLGFNPNLLRVPLGTMIIFAPLWAVGIYAALGIVVLASRLLFPDRKLAVVQGEAEIPVAAVQSVEAREAQEERVLEAA